jgi:hypothetical protein
MNSSGGFLHYRGLRIVAAIGVFLALLVPAFIKNFRELETGRLDWFRVGVVLAGIVLFVLLFLRLIRLFSNREKMTKEERVTIDEEDRCVALRERAMAACRRASAHADGYEKNWKKPDIPSVRQVIWDARSDESPDVLEVLFEAWNAGHRDTELALQLMYASWDRWERDYDTATQSYGGIQSEALIDGFQEPYRYLGGHRSDNPTLLLTAGHMISLFDYRTGLSFNDASMCLERFLKLCPNGTPDAEFQDRGAFGDYFTHIIGFREQ